MVPLIVLVATFCLLDGGERGSLSIERCLEARFLVGEGDSDENERSMYSSSVEVTAVRGAESSMTSILGAAFTGAAFKGAGFARP